MRYARGPLWPLPLVALLTVASASAAYIRPNRLFERADTCAVNFTKCTQPGLPANFCCAPGTTCDLLAGGTTVLCCPDDSDCATIQVISCTLSLQNATANPEAQVKTTVLDGKLPTCRNGCCPFGYQCDSDAGNCVKDADQSKKPGQTSNVPTATSQTTSVPSATSHAPSTTSDANPSSTAPDAAASTSATGTAIGGAAGGTHAAESPSSTAARTLNTAGIVGGVIGGLLGLALLVAGIWLLRRQRGRAAAEREKDRDSTASFGNIGSISAPMPHADYQSQRLDFLAKAQKSSSSASSSPVVTTHTNTSANAHANATAQAQTERYIPNRFLSVSSPYSASVFGLGLSTGGSGRPDSAHTTTTTASKDNNVRRSHHASAEIGGLRSLTDRYSHGGRARAAAAAEEPFTPRTPRGGRLNSGGSESINIFADPSTVGSPSDYGHRDTTYTTWTEFQHHADRPTGSPVPSRR